MSHKTEIESQRRFKTL